MICLLAWDSVWDRKYLDFLGKSGLPVFRIRRFASQCGTQCGTRNAWISSVNLAYHIFGIDDLLLNVGLSMGQEMLEHEAKEGG